MARNKLMLSGYRFSFSKVGGDFKGKVTITEYEHDDLHPNELILKCRGGEYNLGTDVTSFSGEKTVETKTDTSVGKSIGKVALAGIAGKAVQSKRYGTAGVLAAISQGVETEKTTTKTSRDVFLQFKDGKVLFLTGLPANEFRRLEEAYQVFAYENYRHEVKKLQDFIEERLAKNREKLSSLPGSKKKAVFEEIEMLQSRADALPQVLSRLRKKALERGLVSDPTKEEQLVVDGIQKKKLEKLQRKKYRELEKLQRKKDREDKKAANAQAKKDRLTDFEFATKYGYQGLRAQRGIIGIIFLSWITLGLFLPWEIWKRISNKKKWNTILQSDPELGAFKEFRANPRTAD